MLKRILATFILAAAAATAQAAYPDHPIRMVVAWPPGGVTDTVGRFVAERMSAALGQTVVVENHGGANGIIGTQIVAGAQPDGYTIQMVTAETHAINPHVYPNLKYSLSSFEPVALLGTVSFVLAENGAAGPSSVQELVEAAVKAPHRINAGSYGVGSTSHLGLATFESVTKTSFSHIPYQGVAPVMNALLADQVQIAFVNAFNVTGFQKSGKAKILAVASEQRLAVLPDVPTFDELGYAGVRAGNWYGVAVPRGVPQDIKDRLEAALREIAASQVFADKLAAMGVENTFKDGAEFGKFLASENERLEKITQERGITTQ
ncbi:tripartite tricarboxylate transporter substrate binding protein [Bordetella sp. BOR01]|uniref:Bug family tripartite tricarboxylate transporter substrate binding protein n=1 Tax=Bordetella sp. BOR01 TaxID=2854779 RepID=UPI001C45A8B5|nr:tripartite tricarboxylate transporter substrate binding protein [Bordetella sp. BOR01]MBV7481820.1 tripartite tricarboxylate transporter substrate binding protein [Bordetella sp. BOR01]